MTLIHRIEAKMHEQEPLTEERSNAIERIYRRARPEERKRLDEVFTCLCGCTLEVLLGDGANTSTPTQEASGAQAGSVALGWDLVGRLVESVNYEICGRIEEARAEHLTYPTDDGTHMSIMEQLHEDYAFLEHALGRPVPSITVQGSDGTFKIDQRGYPVTALPPAYRDITRVDVAGWCAYHPEEIPKNLPIDDLGYWFKNGLEESFKSPDENSD